MCCINTGRLELKLEVVPVESLLPHEATFPHIVNKLPLFSKNCTLNIFRCAKSIISIKM
jgi:hypothetical protein